jgi:hypothetical protein
MEAADHTYEDTSAGNGSGNGSGQSPWAAHEASEAPVGKPEIPVLAALAGGFVLAKLLKALGGGDE